MIKIDFPSPDGNRLKILVKGHSGFAKEGEDIVCASVSALLQTFVAGVETEMGAEVCGKFESGNCDLSIKVADSKQKLFCVVCKMFRFGFRKIAEAYPKHVEF